MPKTTGLGDRCLVNGHDLSGDIGSLQNIGTSRGEQNMTGIDKSAMERAHLLGDGELTFTSFFTGGDPERAHERLSDLDVTAMVTYMRGTDHGGAAAGLVCKQFQYQLVRAADGGLLGTVNAKASHGSPLEWGVNLTGAGLTSDDDTGTDGDSVDLGASHAIDGLACYLHVLDLDGTDATVVVEDSSDDSAFSTFATFAQVTDAHDYERVAVMSAPARYVRVSVDGDYDEITFVVAVCPLYGTSA